MKAEPTIKTPPLLLGAGLLFWGWQADFLVVSAVMAVALEASRWIRARWEASDDDFSRIWTLCTVLLLGAIVFAFTDNGGPARFSSFFDDSNPATLARASAASARTASAMLRWLPLILFIFAAAQIYSNRPEVPVSTISLLLRRRLQKAQQFGQPIPPRRGMNVSYPYFAVCLFAASVHSAENNRYFWGLIVLIAWALWTRRTRRFPALVWAGVMAVAIVCGFYGERGIGQLQAYLQNLDPQWLTRWASQRTGNPNLNRTSIGMIGRVKSSDKIVIRLTTEPDASAPNYLREATYRIFNSPAWTAGSRRDDFQRVDEDPPNSRKWSLQTKNPSTGRINIACYLDQKASEMEARSGLLPLPLGASHLENLAAFTLRMNSLGTVVAEGPSLVIFDAFYGPGSADAAYNPDEVRTNLPSEPDETNGPTAPAALNPDLYVAVSDRPALDRVISEFNLKRDDPGQTLRAVGSFFQKNFVYSTWQNPVGPRRASTNPTPLGRFLLETRSGHCEFFATATVLLLRQMGIPARYAVGYAVHEPSHNGYVVRLRDAHAWCMVWDEAAKVWREFDTTPSTWVEAESSHSPFWRAVGDLWSWVKFQFTKLRTRNTNLRPYLFATLVPALALLVFQIFFRRRRRQRQRAARSKSTVDQPGSDSEFYLVEKKLAARGIVRETNETLSAWLQRALSDPRFKSDDELLRELLWLHYRYRFDPHNLNSGERETLRIQSQDLSSRITSMKSSRTW